MNLTDKDKFHLILIVTSIIIFAIGLYMAQDRSFSILYSTMMVLGASGFGYGIGEFIQSRILQSSDEYLKRKNIVTDQSTTAFMSIKAKAKTFDVMSKLFPIFILVLAILRENFTTIMLLLGLYILLWGIFIYHLNKIHKKQ
jgi:hypothetical protein